MKIADFFVNLGIKGEPKTVKAMKGVREGLGEMKSMSLEAKAAIVGAIYALERMMSHSAKLGTGFNQFAESTGLSAQELQRWQYAARQVAVDAEDVEASVRGVQSSIANMMMGKGPIEGMAMLANTVGLDDRRLRDTFYMMEKLQEFSQKVPQDVGKAMVASFGITEKTFSAMRQNAFRPDVMSKATVLSERQAKNLQRVNAIWMDLNSKIQLSAAKFFAKHGAGIAGDVSKLADKFLLLADAMVRLGEYLKVFEALGRAMEGIAMISDMITGKSKVDTSAKGIWDATRGVILTSIEEARANPMGNTDLYDQMSKRLETNRAGREQQKNITINQTNTFNEVDAKPKDIKKALTEANKALWSNPAISQGD